MGTQIALGFSMCSVAGRAQSGPLVLERSGRTISLEPYAPNILRVTMSIDKAAATALRDMELCNAVLGWMDARARRGGLRCVPFRADGGAYCAGKSARGQAAQPMPLDALNLELRQLYFGAAEGRPNDGGQGPHNDALQVTTADGKMLLHMRTWTMAPKPGSGGNGRRREGLPVASTFDSPADEHYYGLGQQQKGWMDLRDHEIRCWHDYGAIGGENVCVPFMVSSRGYGLVWDNPSKTTVDLGFNGRNVWSSEVGDRVSYFVIAGDTSDEIYEGYRLLTGVTHMLPKASTDTSRARRFIRRRNRFWMWRRSIARRSCRWMCMVVDFLNMTKQGEMDLDPERWPDPAAMNRELHAMGVDTLLSVWPHFSRGDAVLRHAAEQGMADP